MSSGTLASRGSVNLSTAPLNKELVIVLNNDLLHTIGKLG